MSYVTVIPATKDRNGFMAALKVGSSIRHTRLEAREPEALRAEAQRLYPGLPVWLPGDPIKPWENES